MKDKTLTKELLNNEKYIKSYTELLIGYEDTAASYQQLAMRTCSIPFDQREDMISHAVLGLNSEAGELAGIYQKAYQGHAIDEIHVKKEIGDCLWMIAELCSAYGWSMREVMRLNIEKLIKRYPDGFEIDKSLHRAEGDI